MPEITGKVGKDAMQGVCVCVCLGKTFCKHGNPSVCRCCWWDSVQSLPVRLLFDHEKTSEKTWIWCVDTVQHLQAHGSLFMFVREKEFG